MLTIGILSDTHGVLPGAAFKALEDCDRIIHAGDIVDPNILTDLAVLAPVTAVLGNNDYLDIYGPDAQKYAIETFEGVRFLVTHTPDDLMAALKGTRIIKPGDPYPQVAVHGHTHVPRILSGKQADPADFIVCPGSVSRPRQGSARSIAKVVVADGVVKSVKLIELESWGF